jgi:hypothetical protein
MDDNEKNQNLAQAVLNMVSQGCMIQIRDPGVLATVGYAEMWLDRNIFFYCEIDGGTTGSAHFIKFASFDPLSNQVLFFNENNDLVAVLAPYIEWPEIDAQQMTSAWHAWQKDKAALAGCRQAAEQWRHANLE